MGFGLCKQKSVSSLPTIKRMMVDSSALTDDGDSYDMMTLLFCGFKVLRTKTKRKIALYESCCFSLIFNKQVGIFANYVLLITIHCVHNFLSATVHKYNMDSDARRY